MCKKREFRFHADIGKRARTKDVYKRQVLDGVDARIAPGEFVCILGGNGSGKSTLAKHINALLVPDEGSVTVLDHDTRDERSTRCV